MKGNLSKRKGLMSEITPEEIEYISATLSDKIDGEHENIKKQKADKAQTLEGYGITNAYTQEEIDNKLSQKQNTLIFDDVPTEGSSNPVTSGGIKVALDEIKNNRFLKNIQYIDIDDEARNDPSLHNSEMNKLDVTSADNIYIVEMHKDTWAQMVSNGMNNSDFRYENTGGITIIETNNRNKRGVVLLKVVNNGGDSGMYYSFIQYFYSFDGRVYSRELTKERVDTPPIITDWSISEQSTEWSWDISYSDFKRIDANDKESASNKVTELSESSTDKEYPSARAVTEYVNNLYSLLEQKADTKEDKSNKIIDLLNAENITDNKYPTAKAVTEYVDNSEKETAALLKKKSIPYTTATGCTISISDHLEGESVIDYKIYGNSVQNGTPSPDNPVEIQSVGDLVTDEASEYYGKYDIPIVVNDTITHIYLNKPLSKIGDYADYVDFENHKVVRQINSVKFDQTSYWTTFSGRENLVGTSIENSSVGNRYPCLSNISGFEAGKYSDSNYTGLTSWSFAGNTLMWREDGITVDTFKERLATTPMTVYYILATPTEEPISLPVLTTPKASVANVSIHTTIQPSNISLTYYKGINKVVDGIGGLWGLDLPLIKTITLKESVTSIDILSKAEGIELQEFTVLLFIKYLGDAIESNLNNCIMCLRTNGGNNYFGYTGGYVFAKNTNSYAVWHTKIYDNKFALTDLYRGKGSGNGGGIPYLGSQGLADATTAKYSSYTGYSGDAVDNLNVFIHSNDVSKGAIIPQGSMIFLLGR